MRRKIVVILSIMTVMLALSACGYSGGEEENVGSNTEEFYNDNEKRVNKDQIDEKLEDHLYVMARFDKPTEKIDIYKTELKQFNYDTLQTLFWDEEQLKEVSEDEFGAKFCGDASLGGERGSFIYRRNHDASKMETLCKYYEEKKISEEKDLNFMNIDEVKKCALELLTKTGIGCEFSSPKMIALDSKDIASGLNQLANDEEYKNIISSANLSDYGWDGTVEVYYLEYSMHIGDIGVYGINDPPMQMSSDIPLLAHPMTAEVIISNYGIELMMVQGGVDIFGESMGSVDIIGYDDIKKALLKKYGDVILTQSYTVTNFWLEYVPLIQEGSFYDVDLIPVWCCDFDIDGEKTNYTIRFNAVTGEEIS